MIVRWRKQLGAGVFEGKAAVFHAPGRLCDAGDCIGRALRIERDEVGGLVFADPIIIDAHQTRRRRRDHIETAGEIGWTREEVPARIQAVLAE